MLKVRIIPTLLWKEVGIVKGVRFDSSRRVGALMPAIKVYNGREVDELVLLDVDATRKGRGPDYELVEEVAAECFVPLTVGGGVTDLAAVQSLLRAGADKVCINTAAYANPDFVRAAAERFGSQCIVIAIDARKTAAGTFECVAHCGEKPVGMDVTEWAARVEALGAGEILVTSVDRDGTMTGYETDLVAEVARAVGIPVIASGGAGSYAHMLEAIERGAAAVAASSMFHFTEQTPRGAREFLQSHGVAVRRPYSGGMPVRGPAE